MDLIIFESSQKFKSVGSLVKAWSIPKLDIGATIGHFKEIKGKKRGKVESLGINLEKLEPNYSVSKDKKKVFDELSKKIENADKIYLATDPDNEGHVIAKHVYDSFPKQQDKMYRVLFNEISAKIINDALSKAEKFKNFDPAKAGIGRAILDRTFGWAGSSWVRKSFYGTEFLKGGISLGRVQTPALRLVYERELEIEQHGKQKYYSLTSIYEGKNFFGSWKLNDNKDKNELSEAKVMPIYEKIKKEKNAKVIDFSEGNRIENPKAPFKTADLLSTASSLFGYSLKETGRLLKFGYDNGYTTYPRVDTVKFPQEKIDQIKDYIKENFDPKYLPKEQNDYQDSGNTQEGHAAIWPVDFNLTPEKIKEKNLDPKFEKLYELIWKRAVASQMSPALYDTQVVNCDIKGEVFKSNSEQLNFHGYLKVYDYKLEKTKKICDKIKDYKEGDIINIEEIKLGEHETKPPARYNASSLLKILEKLGIGRPSTYPNIIDTIITREYVEAKTKKKQMFLTMKGRKLIETILKSEKAKEIINYDFTANMETFLDELATGKVPFGKLKDLLNAIYGLMEECGIEFDEEGFVIDNGNTKLGKVSSINKEELDEECPECGEKLVFVKFKTGKKAKRCSTAKWSKKEGNTGCPYIEWIDDEEKEPDEVLEEKCPKCKNNVVLATTRTGKKMKKCSKSQWDSKLKKNIGCDFIEWLNENWEVQKAPEEIKEECPECGANLILSKTKKGKDFKKCSKAKWDPKKKKNVGCEYVDWMN